MGARRQWYAVQKSPALPEEDPAQLAMPKRGRQNDPSVQRHAARVPRSTSCRLLEINFLLPSTRLLAVRLIDNRKCREQGRKASPRARYAEELV